MSTSLSTCAEVAGPVCLLLAERWHSARDSMDDCERHNLEMATMVVLRWISIGDRRAEEKLQRATMLLRLRTVDAARRNA
jgi:hypothetical protein